MLCERCTLLQCTWGVDEIEEIFATLRGSIVDMHPRNRTVMVQCVGCHQASPTCTSSSACSACDTTVQSRPCVAASAAHILHTDPPTGMRVLRGVCVLGWPECCCLCFHSNPSLPLHLELVQVLHRGSSTKPRMQGRSRACLLPYHLMLPLYGLYHALPSYPLATCALPPLFRPVSCSRRSARVDCGARVRSAPIIDNWW